MIDDKPLSADRTRAEQLEARADARALEEVKSYQKALKEIIIEQGQQAVVEQIEAAGIDTTELQKLGNKGLPKKLTTLKTVINALT